MASNAGNVHVMDLDGLPPADLARVPLVVLHNSKLSVGARVTYMLLLSYAQHHERIPVQTTLAHQLKISPRGLRNYINELTYLRLLEVRHLGGRKGNQYYLPSIH